MNAAVTGSSPKQRLSVLAWRRGLLGVAGLLGLLGLMAVTALILSDARRTTEAAIVADAAQLTLALDAFGTSGLRSRAEALLLEAGEDGDRIVFARFADGPLLDPALDRQTNEEAERLRELPFGETQLLQLSRGLAFVRRIDLEALLAAPPGRFADIELFVGRRIWSPTWMSAVYSIGFALTGFAVAALGLTAASRRMERTYRARLRDINRHLSKVGAGVIEPMPEPLDAPRELRELTVQVNRMIVGLRQQIEGLRDFTSLAAHELRSPLARMKIALDRLAVAGSHGPGSTAGDAGPEAVLSSELQDLIHLYDALFELARARSEILDLSDIRPADLVPILRGHFANYFDEGQDDRFDAVLDVPHCLVVNCEVKLVDRALANLIENARKYSPAGSRIEIRANCQGDCFTIAVSNTGGGFPQDVREQAFEAFARSEHVRHAAGLGLGLNLVRAIAVKHGWRVEIVPHDEVAEVRLTGPLSKRTLDEGDAIASAVAGGTAVQ